jgi:hypothetical protein
VDGALPATTNPVCKNWNTLIKFGSALAQPVMPQQRRRKIQMKKMTKFIKNLFKTKKQKALEAEKLAAAKKRHPAGKGAPKVAPKATATKKPTAKK